MEIFARLIPYVRPYTKKLIVSWLLACVIAAMWGANFMAAWPIVKTLFEGKTLHAEVAAMMAESETQIQSIEAAIKDFDESIADRRKVVGENTADGYIMRRTRERSDRVKRLTETNARLATLRWVEYRVLRWIPEDRFQTFMIVLGALFVATLIKCICLYFQEMLVGDVVERTLGGVRQDCLQHALSLDYATTSSEGTATLMSRFTFDAQRMAEGLQMLSGRVIREPLKAIVCIGLALYVNWRLTLLSIVIVPILGFMLYRVGQTLKSACRRMMESMSRIYEQIEETLSGLKVVIAFNREKAHQDRFDEEYDQYLKKAIKVVRYNSLIRPVSELMSTASVVLAMAPCAYLVLSGETEIMGVKLASEPLSVASVAMLYGALAGLLDPCTKLSKVYSRLKQCTAAIDRIFTFLDTKPATQKPAITQSIPASIETLEFRDLSFQYKAKSNAVDSINPLVLSNLNLKIEQGECVAIVGENGCGKSTLLSFLPRFNEPTVGGVFVNGIPLANLDANEFRSRLALVAQDTMLFSGSIVDNIRDGNPEATLEEIQAAADASSVTQFVDNLPSGLETLVGTHGDSLSGGQRQRVSLARAMIRDPQILLLDEATSAIDAQSEQAIHNALKGFVKGRTALMVTHSLTPALLEFVTRIVVLSDGCVEASGTHEKLLATSPTYQKLFGGLARAAA